jgi:hypothetical protein
MVKYEKARSEEGNLLDICYILDKMNKIDQSLKLSLSEINLICGVMISALTSSAVDRGFERL